MVTPIINLWDFTPEPVRKVYTEVKARWDEWEQKFEDWTFNTLPNAYAIKAQAIFKATPFAAMTLIIPWKISVCFLVVGFVADIAFGPFDRELYISIYNGTAIGTGILTLSSAFEFLTTLNPLHLLATFIYGAITSSILPRGNLFA